MNDIERRALGIIARRPTTCANLGAQLWGASKAGGSNCSCPFARPAGAVVKRLRALKLVERQPADVLTLYGITEAGRAFLREEGNHGV